MAIDAIPGCVESAVNELWIYNFAACIRIIARPLDADICAITAINRIVSAASNNTISAIFSVDIVVCRVA
jgi:hypothetical protein